MIVILSALLGALHLTGCAGAIACDTQGGRSTSVVVAGVTAFILGVLFGRLA